MIGRGQVETQHPEDRRQEAFSLPQGQVEDEPERQRGFDGEIGIRPLPATVADAHRPPKWRSHPGQPHGDIAALDQRSVVCRPIPDVVLCRVLWVHARLHDEIMHLLSPRWPGGRSWLTEGAGSCTNAPKWKHQLACEIQAAYRSRSGVRSVALRWSFARQGRAATRRAGSGVARISPGVAEPVILVTIQSRRESRSSVQAGPPRCRSSGPNARRVPISFLSTCLSARCLEFSAIDCATTHG